MPMQAQLDAPGNAVISTGQTAGDPLVRATFGSAYTLDGVGNRTQTDLNEPMMLSYNHETTNYTYSLGNILDTADGNSYTHDANGNRTSKTNGTNVTSYTYDSLNRLTQTSTTGRIIQYIYNGLGQRIGKIDNGVQTNYLVDPNGILPQVLAETDASSNLIAYYVYDGVGLVAQITPDNQYYFYHYDGLGSTIAITDANAQVVNSYAYSPEGLVGVQETIPNPFQYVGRFGVMAEGNGLYFMRARYYDPEVGRFVNRDPIGYAGGINLFAYTGNNLVNLIDPAGRVGEANPFIFEVPITNILLVIFEHGHALVLSGGMITTGTGMIIAGGMTISSVGCGLIGIGEIIVVGGTTVFLNYSNAEFGTDIPTLSDFYPNLFPRYPVRNKKVK